MNRITAAVLLSWMMCADATPLWQIPPEFQCNWVDARDHCRHYQDGDNWRQIDARNILQHEQHCTVVHGVQPDAHTLRLQVLCTEEDSQTARQTLILKRSADGRRLQIGARHLRLCDRNDQ